MADKVVWFELPADNVPRAGDFYQTVFGWQGTDMGGGSLAMVSAESDEQMTPLEPGSINGDISPRSTGFNHPLVVISVEDIAAKILMVEKAGGGIVLAAQEIPSMGMIWAIVRDTEGNHIGIIQYL